MGNSPGVGLDRPDLDGSGTSARARSTRQSCAMSSPRFSTPAKRAYVTLSLAGAEGRRGQACAAVNLPESSYSLKRGDRIDLHRAGMSFGLDGVALWRQFCAVPADDVPLPCRARPLSRSSSDITSWVRETWSQPQTFPSSDHGSISPTAGGHCLEHQSDPQAQVEN